MPSILDITSLFNKLSKEHQNILKRISELAYISLKEGKVVLGLEEKYLKFVIPVVQSYQESLGYVKAFTVFRSAEENKMFAFSHRLIQQFLAAYFVMQSENYVMDLWAETKWTSIYINVWAYYFGLAKAVREEFKIALLGAKYGKNLLSEIANNKMKFYIWFIE